MYILDICVMYLLMIGNCVSHQGEEYTAKYTNEWVVRVDGGRQVAELVALQMGYILIGQVTGFSNTYRMLKMDHPVQRKRAHVQLTERLTQDSRVLWAEQQFLKRRQKRGLVFQDSGDDSNELALGSGSLRRFNDELWDQQWYMQDTRSYPFLPKLDLHVLPCYDLGITGKGVRVSILDDGIEYTHNDLQDNYDSEISYDANDGDEDPSPRYDLHLSNAHGTRCAGEVAMRANNKKCGVGVAYEASIGGVRLLDGDVDDRVEGVALGYAYDKVDVYSASWGPNDDGKTVEGPGRLATEAILRGIEEGRGGKGVIFVWAGGNGGSKDDDCNCDGYIGSIYTLAIGSASQHGEFPWYGEKCAATLATTYSSGAYSDQMIATTDLENSCTIKHTGTSASAPLAAGIIALALQANPLLTWRDVQHLVVWTSEFSPLSHNPGWQINAAGYYVNTKFGFGLMNAYGLVTAAVNWTTVPEKFICQAPAAQYNLSLVQGSEVVLEMDSKHCHTVNYMEHVELELNIRFPVRGDLEIYLISPAGTKIKVLSRRKNDKSDKGFKGWKLMSVLTWGESARGVWKVLITDQVGSSKQPGLVEGLILHLHGTQTRPSHLDSGPRRYDKDYNRIHRKTPQEEGGGSTWRKSDIDLLNNRYDRWINWLTRIQ